MNIYNSLVPCTKTVTHILGVRVQPVPGWACLFGNNKIPICWLVSSYCTELTTNREMIRSGWICKKLIPSITTVYKKQSPDSSNLSPSLVMVFLSLREGWAIWHLGMSATKIDWLIDWLVDWLVDWLIDWSYAACIYSKTMARAVKEGVLEVLIKQGSEDELEEQEEMGPHCQVRRQLLCSKQSSSLYFLHKKILICLTVHLQIDHNASHAYNHNAFWHFSS